MCGGGSFLGDAVSTIVDTVVAPVQDFAATVEKAVTEPDKLTLDDAARLAFPVAGSIAIDQINNPEHAAVAAGALGAAVVAAPAAGYFAAAPATAFPAGSIIPPAAEVLATPVGASLVPTAAAVAAPASAGLFSGLGSGGILSSLGAASLLQGITGAGGKPIVVPGSNPGGFVTKLPGIVPGPAGDILTSVVGPDNSALLSALAGIGQNAQDIIYQIPGASSILPAFLGGSPASAAGLNAVNDVAIPTPAATKAKNAGVGAAIVLIPGGLIAYFAWKWWKGRR